MILLGIIVLGIIIWLLVKNGNSSPNPDPDPNPDPNPDPEPDPHPDDPHPHKWQQVDKTTERWKKYEKEMAYVTSDTKMAFEMIKTVDGKKFYVWTAEDKDYWDLPDEVHEKGKVDCDGFARLTSDGLLRFAKYEKVYWMEYYGYYRHYFIKDDKVTYEVKRGGHAITVYEKAGEFRAFSNTQWWHDKNFGKDFIMIGEETFPEGLFGIICRDGESGIMQWIQEAPNGEIIKGTNVFHRKLNKTRSIKKLSKKTTKGALEWLKSTKSFRT